MLKERIVMFKKFAVIYLALSLALFSGCVSQNKYEAMETELENNRMQMEEEKKSITDLQIQNEKLKNENMRLLESIEDLKFEIEKQKQVTASTEDTNIELQTITDETSRPYSILLSSCQQKESVAKVISEYKQSDLEPYVVKVDLGEKGSWWRIFTGHYETRQGAIIEMNKLGLTDKIVIKASTAKHMDDSKSKTKESNRVSFLMRIDVDPYFAGY